MLKKILFCNIIFCFFCIISGKTEWLQYNTSNSGLSHNDVYAIAFDTNSNIWIGTNGGGINVFDGNDQWTKYDKENSPLTDNQIFSIKIDTNGVKWIGTFENGVFSIDGSNWVHYSTANGLASNVIRSIAIDDLTGDIWVGTDGAGVSKWDGTSWTNFNYSNSLIASNLVYSIDVAGGTKWFGTFRLEGTFPGGLSKFDDNTWETFNIDSGLSSNRVSFVYNDSKGNIWAGTNNFGLNKIDSSKKITLYDTANSGIPDNDIKYITEGFNDNIWIATIGGISRYNNGIWATFNTDNSPLISNFVNVIEVENEEKKWFGTKEGITLLIEKAIIPPEAKVHIQGGVKGYVNPELGEQVKIFYTKSGSGKVVARIYTLNGLLVWKGSNESGNLTDSIIWDCRNSKNETVSSGVYIIIVEGPGIESIKKVPIIR